MGTKTEVCEYELNVALAKNMEDCKVADLSNYYISRKLDGVRCIAIVGTDRVDYWSRSGKRYTTLEALTPEILDTFTAGTILDGEICSVDEHGNEDFQSVMTEVRRKNYTMKNPRYMVFDLLTYRAMDNCIYSTRSLGVRLAALDSILHNAVTPHLCCVRQVKYTPKDFETLQVRAAENNWEGLILRKDTQYNGKRSSDLLKVKAFCDDEYTVTGVEFSDMPKMGLYNVIGSIKIMHKGNEVSVGSGLSISQREAWAKNPNLIIGKVVTVKYMEETKNLSGTYSLRHPVLKCVYGEVRDV